MRKTRWYEWPVFAVGLLVAAFMCMFVGAAFAQAHPCDQPGPATITIQSGAPHKVQFCQPQTDNIEALVARVDANTFADLVPVTARTTPSASGLVLYESTFFLQVSRGTHTLELATYNRNALTNTLQLGAFSSPLSFGAVDDTPRPSAPIIKGVVKQ